MATYDYEVGGRRFRERRVPPVPPGRYTLNEPNPEWESKGRIWLDYVINRFSPTVSLQPPNYDQPVDSHNDVAYIPERPITITQGRRQHHVIPTQNESNLYAYNRGFRLNAKNQSPGGNR